jgi:hypothetical protein
LPFEKIAVRETAFSSIKREGFVAKGEYFPIKRHK